MDNSNFNLFIDVSKFSNKYDNKCVLKIINILKQNITQFMVICNKDNILLCFYVLNYNNKM